MIRYLCPVFAAIILVSSVANCSGLDLDVRIRMYDMCIFHG